MQKNFKVILSLIFISTFVLSACFINTGAMDTQQEEGYLSETRSVIETMNATLSSGKEEQISTQLPPTTRGDPIISPRAKSLSFPEYTGKENITVLSNPQKMHLDPLLMESALQWQNQSYSEIRVNASGSYTILNDKWYGNQTAHWSKVYNKTYWFMQSYGYWIQFTPIQPANLIWEMNMTIPWSWDFHLNLQWYSVWSNLTFGASSPPYYLDTAEVAIYNYHSLQWDILRAGYQSDGSFQEDLFAVNYLKYVNPTTKNITVQIRSGESQNSSYSLMDMYVGFAGAYTDKQLYRCQNATGSWESEIVELLRENQYYYEELQVDLDNVSYVEGIDQTQPVFNNMAAFGDGVVTKWAQSFQPMENNYFAITVQLSKVGAPLDAVELVLYEAVGDLPIGSPLASDYLLGTQIPVAPLFAYFNFTIKYHLNTSKQYCFVVQRNGAQDPINYYQVAVQNGGNPYSGGKASWNDGIIWNIESLADLLFDTWYFIDSFMNLEYRTSPDNATWSSWNRRLDVQFTDFGRHLFKWNINQNKTRYLQIRLNLSSNHPHYLPSVYNITLFYLSYEWNYSVFELDDFSFKKLGSAAPITRIGINLTLYINVTPTLSWIKILNISSQEWKIFAGSLQNGTWLLSGSNIHHFYNGSFYLWFWALNKWDPFTLVKEKNITFWWTYYNYTQQDLFQFTIEDPELIHIYFTINQTIINLLTTNLKVFNITSEQWVTFLNNLTGDIPAEWPIKHYNGTFSTSSTLLTATPTPIQKNITIVVFYLPPPTDIWTWLTPILVIVTIGIIAAVLFYKGYWEHHQTEATVIAFQ